MNSSILLQQEVSPSTFLLSTEYLSTLTTSPTTYAPFYYTDSPSVLSWMSDLNLSLFGAFIVYWLMSGLFEIIDNAGLECFERYRIHEPEEVKTRNRVTRFQCLKAVLVQQFFQTVLGLVFLPEEHAPMSSDGVQDDMLRYARVVVRLLSWSVGSQNTLRVMDSCGKELIAGIYWWVVPVAQFLWASFVLDTWQYFLHRAMHLNKFLYKHLHSHHHRLYVPYAYGALYNHPIEGLVLDSLGTLVASLCAGLNTRQDILLFSISTAKTIDDHCGFSLPWDPFQILFPNNADYHDIHHQQFGIKKNFSQPYFTHWDRIMGTRMTRDQVPRKRHTDQRDPLVKTGEAVPSLPNAKKDL